ncbi:hypothetical protein [Clostridium sardiniense]|uniref:hypothetical protein n=1 Tax=Clostridium sardiniense TaxID=29369 RepID=UPI003D346103
MKSILKIMVNISVCLLIFLAVAFIEEVFEKSNTSVYVKNSILVLIYIIGAALFVIKDFLKVQNKNYIMDKKILYEYKEERFNNIIIIFAVINSIIVIQLLTLLNTGYIEISYSTNLFISLYTFLFISILTFTFYFITAYRYKNKIFEEGIELYTSEFKKFNEITKIVYKSTIYGTRCKYKIFFRKGKTIINIDEGDSDYIKEILEKASNIKVK